MELSEALDELLEFWSLFWIQGPATSHHCKSETENILI